MTSERTWNILLVMWFGTDLSSVLSAREMAGFLTALLHAWLLLHRKTIRQQRILELLINTLRPAEDFFFITTSRGKVRRQTRCVHLM